MTNQQVAKTVPNNQRMTENVILNTQGYSDSGLTLATLRTIPRLTEGGAECYQAGSPEYRPTILNKRNSFAAKKNKGAQSLRQSLAKASEMRKQRDPNQQ